MVFVFIVPAQCMDIALIDEMITYWDALQEIFTSGTKKAKTLPLGDDGGDDLIGLGGDRDSEMDLLDGLDLPSSSTSNMVNKFNSFLIFFSFF
jgi:hypothetical protein